MRRRPPGLGFGIGFRLNRSAEAGSGALPPTPPYLGVVASRSHSPTYVTTTQNQVMSSIGFDWTESVASVQLLIPTFYCPSGVDLIAAGSVTYSVTSITSTATVPNNTPSLIVAVFNPTSNSVSLFINGVADVTGTFASSGNFSATNSAAANIAAFNTLLASVLNALFAADKAVTTDERQKLEGFLAHNAGLAASLLPAGHPYLAAPPVAN